MLAYDGLVARGWLADHAGSVFLTNAGADGLGALGIDPALAARARRTFCRPCLDWGERRHHLGGALGAALLDRLYALRWACRAADSRVVVFTPSGEQQWRDAFAA